MSRLRAARARRSADDMPALATDDELLDWGLSLNGESDAEPVELPPATIAEPLEPEPELIQPEPVLVEPEPPRPVRRRREQLRANRAIVPPSALPLELQSPPAPKLRLRPKR